jgi:hypothetical protein
MIAHHALHVVSQQTLVLNPTLTPGVLISTIKERTRCSLMTCWPIAELAKVVDRKSKMTPMHSWEHVTGSASTGRHSNTCRQFQVTWTSCWTNASESRQPNARVNSPVVIAPRADSWRDDMRRWSCNSGTKRMVPSGTRTETRKETVPATAGCVLRPPHPQASSLQRPQRTSATKREPDFRSNKGTVNGFAKLGRHEQRLHQTVEITRCACAQP